MQSLLRHRRQIWLVGIVAVVVVLGVSRIRSSNTEKRSVSTRIASTVWHGLRVYAPSATLDFPITHTNSEWHRILNTEQYDITRNAGTEPPFSGALLYEHRKGTFYSVASGEPLFSSKAKFDSGTGWPSFYQPISRKAVLLRWDNSFGMRRVEVIDSASGSHLGHLFNDGPAPTGLRYCIDSEALIFVPAGSTPPPIVASYLKSHQDATK